MSRQWYMCFCSHVDTTDLTTIVIYRVSGIIQLFAPVVRSTEFHADIYFNMSAHNVTVERMKKGEKSKKCRASKPLQISMQLNLCRWSDCPDSLVLWYRSRKSGWLVIRGFAECRRSNGRNCFIEFWDGICSDLTFSNRIISFSVD